MATSSDTLDAFSVDSALATLLVNVSCVGFAAAGVGTGDDAFAGTPALALLEPQP